MFRALTPWFPLEHVEFTRNNLKKTMNEGDLKKTR